MIITLALLRLYLALYDDDVTNRQNNQLFYESSGDCVKVLDSSATLLSFNPKGYEIMEIDDPDDVIGSSWLDFWKDDMQVKAQIAFKQALAGKMGSFEGFCPTYKGTPKWWQVSIAPLKNEFDEVQWILSISRDVTELVSLREENQQLKSALKQPA